MYNKDDKKLEVVMPKEQAMPAFKDVEAFKRVEMADRNPTWVWVLVKSQIFTALKGVKPLQGIAPPGNLARKIQ
eukprot:703730-Karenia_brevis.AAC.1